MDAISFGTDGWRATLEEFTDERVRMVGQAVADHLVAAGFDPAEDTGGGGDAFGGSNPTVAVGYDARESSPGFAESLTEVLTGNGFDVLLPGRDVPTPLVAFAVVEHELAGGCMITASHNPPEYNGVKFIPADGAPALPSVTDDIEGRLAEPRSHHDDEWGTVVRHDFVPEHAAAVTDLLDVDLSEVTVVYDAIHGSGRGVTDSLLEGAGADVIRRRCERDSTFGGGAPEPSPENLEGLAEAVEEHDADLGIANDGDADRVAVCTPGRGYLDENLLFGVFYEYLLEEQSGAVVRSVSTTFLLDRIAKAHEETVHEVPVGFKYVASAMAAHDALIGGEESGGFTIRGHVREKDGVMAAFLAAAAAAEEPLDDRVDRLFEAHGQIFANKVSVACPDDRKEAVLAELADVIPETVCGTSVADVVTMDGFKLLLADGSWLLVRPSGTEPKLRVYAEAGSEDDVAALLSAGEKLLGPLLTADGV